MLATPAPTPFAALEDQLTHASITHLANAHIGPDASGSGADSSPTPVPTLPCIFRQPYAQADFEGLGIAASRPSAVLRQSDANTAAWASVGTLVQVLYRSQSQRWQIVHSQPSGAGMVELFLERVDHD